MQRILAGGIVFLSLIVMADIDQLAAIAVAFAYLILLSAAMTVGPVAFARISALVTGSSSKASSSTAFSKAHSG